MPSKKKNKAQLELVSVNDSIAASCSGIIPCQGASLILPLISHHMLNHSLAQSVKLMVSMGVLLGYPLQFFVAVQVTWPSTKQMCGIEGRSLSGELIFRTLLVIVTCK